MNGSSHGSNVKRIYSAAFNIDRGVIQIQGDNIADLLGPISPILFILALDQLVRTHDVHGTGYNCGHYSLLKCEATTRVC